MFVVGDVRIIRGGEFVSSVDHRARPISNECGDTHSKAAQTTKDDAHNPACAEACVTPILQGSIVVARLDSACTASVAGTVVRVAIAALGSVAVAVAVVVIASAHVARTAVAVPIRGARECSPQPTVLTTAVVITRRLRRRACRGTGVSSSQQQKNESNE